VERERKRKDKVYNLHLATRAMAIGSTATVAQKSGDRWACSSDQKTGPNNESKRQRNLKQRTQNRSFSYPLHVQYIQCSDVLNKEILISG
jgi:hypothetical protein